jgi:NAD(P)-dependent dehydrogenase (short-subunit alcohol dehydrogenase family)
MVPAAPAVPGPLVVSSLLVAGADGALGRATAQHLARRGVRVFGSCFSEAALRATEAALAADVRERVHLRVVDLADEAAVEAYVAAAHAQAGRLDGLVNAAGGFRWVEAQKATVADFDFLMGANLKSSWLLVRSLLPRLKDQGTGRIVLVSSRATQGLATAGMGLYLASKSGINALVESVAAEVADTRINVNAVLPTTIDTPANRRDMPKADFGKWVALDQLVGVIDLLLGEATAPINGALIPVTGRL